MALYQVSYLYLYLLALAKSTLGDSVWARLAAYSYGAVKALPLYWTWNMEHGTLTLAIT